MARLSIDSAIVPAEKIAPVARDWSPQQNAIFAWFTSCTGNLVVRARAGTGKTTTILEAVKRAPESRILLAAFNKSIATELTARLPANSNIEAQTLHSLGFSIVRKHWRSARVDASRGRKLARHVVDSHYPDSVADLVAKLASRCKGQCPFPSSVADFVRIAQDAQLEPDSDHAGATIEYVADRAYAAMQCAQEPDGTVDFDDMVYVPVANGWAKPTFDLVVIDEAQDMNFSQIALARGVASSRIAVVGDDRQAIYGFRGADSGSIDRLKAELSASELGLTVTYRCPRTVVALAAQSVPDFVAAPSAPAGEIIDGTEAMLLDAARAGDFVLSRKNAPLARLCLAFIRAGKVAKVQGRDIGAQLIATARKIAGKTRTEIGDFVAAVEAYRAREHEAAARLDEDRAERRRATADDVCETLLALTDGAASVSDVVGRIETMFADLDANADRAIVLSSVHKAKGLERDRVWVLCETFSQRNTEEINLWYVAVTRAKSTLVRVQG